MKIFKKLLALTAIPAIAAMVGCSCSKTTNIVASEWYTNPIEGEFSCLHSNAISIKKNKTYKMKFVLNDVPQEWRDGNSMY